MSFVGGRLKLKGGDGLKLASGVKKKKKKKAKEAGSDGAVGALMAPPPVDKGEGEDAAAATEAAADAEASKRLREGYALAPTTEAEDRRTEAERRHEARMDLLEEERMRKVATKSHRERVKEFNDYLANLSEHHDIPKVGPG